MLSLTHLGVGHAVFITLNALFHTCGGGGGGGGGWDMLSVRH